MVAPRAHGLPAVQACDGGSDLWHSSFYDKQGQWWVGLHSTKPVGLHHLTLEHEWHLIGFQLWRKPTQRRSAYLMEAYHAYPNPSTAQRGTDLTPQGHYHTAYKPPTTRPGATITETYHRGEILTLSFFDAFKGVKGKGMGVKGKHGKGRAQEALAEEVKGKGVKGVKGCKGKGKGVKSKHIKGKVQVALTNLSEEDLEEEALAEEAPSEEEEDREEEEDLEEDLEEEAPNDKKEEEVEAPMAKSRKLCRDASYASTVSAAGSYSSCFRRASSEDRES